MQSKFDGIPLKIDPEKLPSQLYEGIEYKKFWLENPKNRLDELEHTLINNLLPASGHRIIDIGCGFGRLADCYLDKFDEVVMLDGSMSLLRQAQEVIGDRAIYIAADANYLPFDKASFDCVLMIRIFHHLTDSQAILNKLNYILGKNGILIFNYCNKSSARQLTQWLLNTIKENPFTLEPAGIGTPFIRHHPDYISRVIKNAGFSKVHYLGAGVMDKLADKFGKFSRLVPSGKLIAPVLGTTKLAPWINCRAVSSGETPTRNTDIEELLICPACQSNLSKTPQAYQCTSCERSYPILDNIVDFRFQQG